MTNHRRLLTVRVWPRHGAISSKLAGSRRSDWGFTVDGYQVSSIHLE